MALRCEKPMPAHWSATWRGRAVAALVGATVSAAAAVIGFWLVLDYLAFVGLFGIAGGAATGFLFAPSVVAAPRPGPMAVALGLLAVPLGLLLIALPGIAGPEMAVGSLLGLVAVSAIAIPVAAPVSVPVAYLATLVGRRLAQLRLAQAAALVVASAIVAGAAGWITLTELERRNELAARGQEPAGDHWIDLLTSPVDLRWTVTNQSDRDMLLYLAEPTADGEIGAEHYVPACSVRSGVEAIGAEWRLHLIADPYADASAFGGADDVPAWPPDYGAPVVTSDELTIPDPAVGLVVGPDTRISFGGAGTMPPSCEPRETGAGRGAPRPPG